MLRRLAGSLLFVLLVPFPVAPAWGQAVFANGFETPCDPADTDEDRLSGCEEKLLKTDPADPDTDGDGLLDGDEVLGTIGGLNLPAMGVDARRKDILLEYDWFNDSNEAGTGTCGPGVHSHRPTQAMLDLVTVMFGAAPVANPNGVPGINIIHDFGQGGVFTGGNLVPDADGIIVGAVSQPEYDAIYSGNFDNKRRGYFHYVLLPHRYNLGGEDNSSGFAEILGAIYTDEIIVSLYCAFEDDNVGKTIAHELGHNLRLHHGGGMFDACNQKPNYNSIMNYRYQFDGVDTNCQVDIEDEVGPADFSRGKMQSLDESEMVEADGICIGVPIDWNGDGQIEGAASFDMNPYSREVEECGGTITVLDDHDDWANIVLPILSDYSGEGSGGETSPVDAQCPAPPVFAEKY